MTKKLPNIKFFLVFIVMLFIFRPQIVAAWGPREFYDEATSPISQDKARRVLYVGGATTLILVLFFEDSIIDPTQQEVIENNKLGSFNNSIELMGRVVPNALYAISMLGASYLSDEPSFYKESAEVMIKATFYASLATTILKYSIQQKRPHGNAHNSFPSGHTTTAFAFASVVAERHPWYVGVPAYMLAGLVGFQRINGNRHYLHDVVAGATIGTVFGIGINSLIKSKNESAQKIGFFPLEGGGAIHWAYNI